MPLAPFAVAEDFQRLFNPESPHTPSVIAVAVGAGSDNTQDQSLACLSHLRWLPQVFLHPDSNS